MKQIDFFEQKLSQANPISEGRMLLLDQLVELLARDSSTGNELQLNFICTHNSRRSQMAQLWAQSFAEHFDLSISCFSAGTEATAFNDRAVKAMRSLGFLLNNVNESSNPNYEWDYSDQRKPLELFSKLIDHPKNPSENFTAIMVCDHADQNCPIVFGASNRFSLPFIDPGYADGSPEEEAAYLKAANTIGLDLYYVFKQLKNAR